MAGDKHYAGSIKKMLQCTKGVYVMVVKHLCSHARGKAIKLDNLFI